MLISQSGPISSLLHFFHWYTRNTKLIGPSRARELLPGIIEMMRTGFRKLYFFFYSLLCTTHDFKNNRKTMLTETNQSLLIWDQPLPYAQKVSPLILSCLARSGKKPLLIVETSLKIRYFDFKERSYSINL